ncbi:hypothetical protein ACSBR1_017381 [Camellia fascicularis]
MCLKEGLRERDWSTDTPLAKDNLGPQVGPPSAKTRETSCEKRELSSSEDLELRKESNWLRVGDLEPAVIKLRTTLMERV